MITINAPQNYCCGFGLLEGAGRLIREIAGEVLIIAGARAFDAVKDLLLASLDEAGVKYGIALYQGHTTAGDISAYGKKAAAYGAMLAAGGGKVLDLAKAAADEAGLPVITIPTIASNCAAYTPLSVIYDEKGAYTGSRILRNAPRLVLADAGVLAKAPRRFLAAGMGDTLAKLLEARSIPSPADVNTSLGISIARQAWDAVYPRHRDAFGLAGEALEGSAEARRLFVNLLDCIFFLAGLIGSMRGGDYVSAYIHPLGDAFTKTGEGGKVHGEVIAFCNIVQAALYGEEETVNRLLAFNTALGLPTSLADLGYADAAAASELLARTFDWDEVAALASTPFEHSRDELRQAMLWTQCKQLRSLRATAEGQR
jgi:glycerol dehydrogenase